MDIPRPKARGPRRLASIGLVALALAGTTYGVGRLKRAPPSIERASIWVDQVKRGSMLRAVRGPGTLVPEHIRWITADTAGRVERIAIRPGEPVSEDTPLLELANPDVLLQALEAERQLASAEAALLELKSTLEGQRLSQEASLATLRTELADARRRAGADASLEQKQLAAHIEAEGSRDKAAELATRVRLEEERLKVLVDGMKDRLAAQRAQVEKLRAVAQFRQRQVESMHVKAGGAGILQELPLELGQWVTPGTLLAKVVQPDQLKAELRIPETQARDLQRGLSAEIDTRNGIVLGVVSRVDPAARDGAVRVEVSLTGPLPKGARPDLTVEGSIQLERLPNVLYLGRPTGAQPESTVELFRLSGNDAAERVKVRLGRASVDTIEVLSGLSEGDRVVVSDMSSWDNVETVRLK